MTQPPLTTLELIGAFAEQNAINDFAPDSPTLQEHFEHFWGENYVMVCQLALGKNLTYYKDEPLAGIRTIVVGDKSAAMATITDYGTGLQGPVRLNIVKVFITPTGLYHLYIKALPINIPSKRIVGLVYLDDVWSAGCAQNGLMFTFSKRRNLHHNKMALYESGLFHSYVGTLLGFTFSFLPSFDILECPSLILPGWVDQGVFVTPFGVSDKREEDYPIPGYALKEKAEWMDLEMYGVLSTLFADGAKTFSEVYLLGVLTRAGSGKFFKIKYLEKLVGEGVLTMEYYYGKKYFSPSIKLLMAMKQ